MDALVITPRVCGICGTAHLYAAVSAIERALVPIGPNGTRVRNLCLMAREIQSDTRHAFLMFTIDLCNPKYPDRPGYDEIVAAFEPFKGRVYREVIVETKKVLDRALRRAVASLISYGARRRRVDAESTIDRQVIGHRGRLHSMV